MTTASTESAARVPGTLDELVVPVFSRHFAMASMDTFDCWPIGQLVQRFLAASKVSVDPFARNRRWATHTNDINPNTAAEHHMDAREFLRMLRERGVVADLVILDPPYSPRQISDCYQEAGLKVTMQDTQNARLYAEVKDEVVQMLERGGRVISCGWNTAGMQSRGGWIIEELMIVCHGAGRNDTLVMVEREDTRQGELFSRHNAGGERTACPKGTNDNT